MKKLTPLMMIPFIFYSFELLKSIMNHVLESFQNFFCFFLCSYVQEKVKTSENSKQFIALPHEL